MKRKLFFMFATLLLCLVLVASVSHGGDYYVNPESGVDTSNSGTDAHDPWKSITYAVATVPAGTAADPIIIHLASGHYFSGGNEIFPIILNDHVHLTGESGATTIISPGSYNEIPDGVSLYNALSIEGVGVVVQNLTIENAFIGISCVQGGFTIQDNVFADTINYMGIYTAFSNPDPAQSYSYEDFTIINNSFTGDATDTDAPYIAIVLGHEISFDSITEDLTVSLGNVSISGNTFNLSPFGQRGIINANNDSIMDMAAGNQITTGDITINDNIFTGGDIGISVRGKEIRNITATSGVALGDIHLSNNHFSSQRNMAISLGSSPINQHQNSGNISGGHLRIEHNIIDNSLKSGIYVLQERVGYLDGSASITKSGITVSDNQISVTGNGRGVAVEIRGPEYLGSATGSHSSQVNLGTTTIRKNQVTSSGQALYFGIDGFLYSCDSDTVSRLGAVTITGNTLQGTTAASLHFSTFGEDTYGNASAEFDRFTIEGNALIGTGGNGLDIELDSIGYYPMHDNSRILFPEIVVQNNSLKSSSGLGIFFDSGDAAEALEDAVHVDFGGLQIKNNIFNPDKGAGMAAGILYKNYNVGYDISGQVAVSYDPVEISGNSFYNMEQSAIEIIQDTIGRTSYSTATTSITLPDLLITGNTIDGAATGLKNDYVSFRQDAGSFNIGSFTFAENILKNMREGGLIVSATDISNNVPLTSTMNLGGMTVRDNEFIDGGNAGISFSLQPFSGEGITVAEHTVSGNSVSGYEQGIMFNSVVGEATLSCNTLENNSQYGFGIDGVKNDFITLKHNSILNNTILGLSISATSDGVVEARDNWWGDPAGPAACASCNTINAGGGTVRFAPWLYTTPTAQCGAAFPWTMFLPAIIGANRM